LNILLDDIRIHPKRYTGGIAFSKKDNSPPLTKPVADSIPKPSSNRDEMVSCILAGWILYCLPFTQRPNSLNPHSLLPRTAASRWIFARRSTELSQKRFYGRIANAGWTRKNAPGQNLVDCDSAVYDKN
jgi:hypothetical protein